MKPITKKIVKRISQGMVLLVLVALVFRFVFYDNVKQWVIGEVRNYLTQMDYGDLEIGAMDISLFHAFPNITVNINEISFYEKKDSLRLPNEPSIVEAKRFNLAFDSWELIRNKNLIVTSLSIENGIVALISYEDNKTNLERAFRKSTKIQKQYNRKKKEAPKKTDAKPKPPNKNLKKPKTNEPPLFSVDLEEILLKNITLKYHNPSEHYSSQIELTALRGELLLNKQGISCNLETAFEIVKSAQLPTIAKQGPMTLKLNLDFIDVSQLIKIHQGNLSFKNLNVAVSGLFDHNNGNYIDMAFDASSNNTAFLSRLLNEDILHQNKSLVEKANIILSGKIKGKFKNSIPRLDVRFGVKDLSIAMPSGKGKFSNIGFEGEWHSNEKPDFSGAKLSIRNISGNTPGGSMSGNVLISDLKNPYIKSDLKVSLNLDALDEVLDIPSIDSLQGKLNFVSEMDGKLHLENQDQLDSIGSWSLKMEDIGFRYLPSNKKISKLRGAFSESQNLLEITDFGMNYDSSEVAINGQIKNLYHFIFNKEQNLLAELTLKSNQIYTDHFIVNGEGTAAINDRMSNVNVQTLITMDDNTMFNSYFPKINVDIKNLSFNLDKLPNVSKVEGRLDLYESERGYIIDIQSLNGVLPQGAGTVNGTVLFPKDFMTLDVKTMFDIKNMPQEYIIELINEMNDFKLIGANTMNPKEMTLINGKVAVTTEMDLFPFALQKSSFASTNMSITLPDTSIYEAQNVNLVIDSLNFTHQSSSKTISGVKNIKGALHIDAFNTSSFSNIPIDADFTAVNDTFNIRYSIFRDTLLQDAGTLFLDLSKSPALTKGNYSLKNIDITSVLNYYTSEKLAGGTIHAAIDFEAVGDNLDDLISSMKGNASISGDSLSFYGVDLDNILRKYERSQKFNLADVSAFVIAGPMGAAATKGADFTNLMSANFKPEESTYVAKAITNWNINQGVLNTTDVAFSTRLNRLAFKGSLDFIKDSIPGFTVYVVDKKGCSLMEQTIYGKFNDIQMGKLKLAKTLLGSVINLVNTVVGAKCEAVYAGAIKHPMPKK